MINNGTTERQQKRRRQKRRLLYVILSLFGMAFIVVVVRINLVYLLQHTVDQQTLHNAAGDAATMNDRNESDGDGDGAPKSNNNKPSPVVKFNSISTAKDHFSVRNEKHQTDFTMAYNPNRNKRITTSTEKKKDENNENEKKQTNDDLPQKTKEDTRVDIILPPAAVVETEQPVEHIRLLLPPKEIEWIIQRNQLFNESFNNNEKLKNARKKRWNAIQFLGGNNRTSFPYGDVIAGETPIYEEDSDGPWLDFMIAGHPKCGTTTLVANLANLAPMKVKDFCTGDMSTLLSYLYRLWPKKFPEIMDGPNKYIKDKNHQLKGAKCPRFIGDPDLILKYGPRYPKTKLIIGIRHPVLWFTSFIKMGNVGDLYSKMKICPNIGIPGVDPATPLSIGSNLTIPLSIGNHAKFHDDGRGPEICIGDCRCGLPVCFHRARLHLPLARLGKTQLLDEERQLLAPEDPDGGSQLLNGRITNQLFVYDQTQMNSKEGANYWEELAKFLGVSHIPNESYHGSKGVFGGGNKTLCVDYYDEFRAKLMEHSYNMSIWLEDYFLPISLNPQRQDVTIINPNEFRTIIQSYKEDPCERLIRNPTTGKFELKPSIDVDNGLGPGVYTKIIGTGKVKPCRPIYDSTMKKRKEEQDEKEAVKKATAASRRTRGKRK